LEEDPKTSPSQSPQLLRGLGLPQATALNIANMIGIGPFITIPLFLKSMGGPQAMIGWVIAAVLVICDGLVWSELGAALPGSGGPYHFLKETFGRYRWGRIVPFLFIWQFLVTGTLELASGYRGMWDYLLYVFPSLGEINSMIPGGLGWLGAALSILVTLALCRRVHVVGWLSVVLCAGTLATVGFVIAAGVLHFDATLLRFPEGAFHVDGKFATGLGGAMLIAIYDYLGYYNVCHMGEEVRDPGKTIPRAVIISVVLVAAIYLVMNVCIIAVVPWREAMDSKNIAALFMERLFGRAVSVTFTWCILWTALACVFVMTLGYSRIPFAAARSGDFFPVFAKLHSKGRYPWVSLLAIGGLTSVFCFVSLQDLIDAAVTIRILVPFIAQIAALHMLRKTRPDVPMPFRMRLYPLPSLLALIGWLYTLCTSSSTALWLLLVVYVSGIATFCVWQAARRRRGGWATSPPDGAIAAPSGSHEAS
jgi:amino acid transporter